MAEQYLYLSSNNALEDFPRNNAHTFTVQLPQALRLGGQPQDWVIGLMEISFSSIDNRPFLETINFQLEEIVYSPVNGTSLPVLRRIVNTNTSSNQNFIVFNPVLYINLNTTILPYISVSITNLDNTEAKHLEGITRCTLHIKKKSLL
jgi:hypothetical protein